MFTASIGDNVIALLMYVLFLSSTTVFWVSLTVMRKQVSERAVALFWEKAATLRVACFLSLIMTTSHQEALLARPTSRVIQTGILSLFWGFLLLGLCTRSISEGLLQQNTIWVLNYLVWVMLIFLGLLQSIRFSREIHAYEI